jgi:hypothetical protein
MINHCGAVGGMRIGRGNGSSRGNKSRSSERKMAGSNIRRDTGYRDTGFRGSPQFLQANAGIIRRLYNDRHLPNSLFSNH